MERSVEVLETYCGRIGDFVHVKYVEEKHQPTAWILWSQLEPEPNREVDKKTLNPNFRSMDEVMRLLASYTSMSAYKGAQIVQYIGRPLAEGQIGVLEWRAHYYVLVSYRNTIYYGDGVNTTLRNKRFTSMIRRCEPNKRLQHVIYGYQRYSDECASSAVLIVLEMARYIKNGDIIPAEISPPEKLRKRVIRRLHPYKHPTDEPPFARRFLFVRKCIYCQGHITQRLKRLLHQRFCRVKQAKH